MAQTTQQFNNSILLGSAKIEVGDDVGSLTNLGLMNGVSMAETWEKLELIAQNGGVYKNFVTNHRLSVSATALEVHPDAFEAIRGSIDTWEAVAGTPVAGASQVVASGDWSFDTFIPIENQNGDGSRPTVNSVTGGTDGALTEDTDYYVIEVNGVWGISVDDSVAVTTEAQTITINYDYTPNSSTKMIASGTVSIPFKVVRLTHESPEGQVVTVTVPYSSVDSPLELTFVDDAAPTEPISHNISFLGTVHPTTNEVFTIQFEGF